MHWFKKSFEPELKLNRNKYITLEMRLLDLAKKKTTTTTTINFQEELMSQLCYLTFLLAFSVKFPFMFYFTV